MKLKLTRRRFGQLAIASSATATFAYLATKTFAQTPPLVFLGIRPAAKSRAAGGLILQAINVALNQIDTLPTPPIENPLERSDQLTGFSSATDGSLVLSIAPGRASKKEKDPNRLEFLGTSRKSRKISNKLQKFEKIDSLLVANDGSYLALLKKKNGKPRVFLVSINPSTGDFSLLDKFKLPEDQRFNQLAQGTDGRLYTTSIDPLGRTRLVHLDLAGGKPNPLAQLTFNGRPWNNGLLDLASSPASPSNELFALGAPRYVTPNKLYKLDVNTGVMTLVSDFNVTKITASLV